VLPASAMIGWLMQTCDVVIVCAIQDELDAVKNASRTPWKSVPITPADAYTYEATTVTSSDGATVNVICAVASHMGLTPSAVLTTKMILRFHPRLVAMIGVAAGVASNGRDLGDILVPDTTYDYETGKVTRAADGTITFQPSPTPLDVDTDLLSRLKAFARQARLDEISREYQGPSSGKLLKIHIGPIGSGAAVVDDPERIKDAVKAFSRKLVGIEMELYAVHRACRDATRHRPTFIGMKSIMDFAENKNDTQKHYAAYTAAELFWRFIKNEWSRLPLAAARPSQDETYTHLNDVIRMGVECLQTLLPGTQINGRYFALGAMPDGKRVLRRMNNLHVESVVMTGEQALNFAYVDSDALFICESFRECKACLRQIPPQAQSDYSSRISNQIDPKQKWVLCCPVFKAGSEPVGVLCFFSREDIDYSPGSEERLSRIAVVAARAFASALVDVR
jgi:nucleoside phosphorylase